MKRRSGMSVVLIWSSDISARRLRGSVESGLMGVSEVIRTILFIIVVQFAVVCGLSVASIQRLLTRR